jgi:hypothetical protein
MKKQTGIGIRLLISPLISPTKLLSSLLKTSELFEGYGLQAVHSCCLMNPALAAEGCDPT